MASYREVARRVKAAGGSVEDARHMHRWIEAGGAELDGLIEEWYGPARALQHRVDEVRGLMDRTDDREREKDDGDRLTDEQARRIRMDQRANDLAPRPVGFDSAEFLRAVPR